MNKENHSVTWAVLNQSQSQEFQELLTQLSNKYGASQILTGRPYPSTSPSVNIIPSFRYQRKSIFHRVLSWILFGIHSVIYLSISSKKKIVLVTTNPPFLLHVAWIMSYFRHYKYIILNWDLYPEHLQTANISSDKSAVFRLWSRLNSLSYAKASAVVSISEQMHCKINSKYPDLSPRHFMIPGFANTSRIYPVQNSQNPFKREHISSNHFTILYSGNIGASHGLINILKAARLLQMREDIEFIFVGEGLGLASLKAYTNTYQLRNIKFLPSQPDDILAQVLSSADIGIVSQAPGTSSYSLPSKTYNLIAAGCIILALSDHDSDLSRTIWKYSLGIACECKPQLIARSILAIMNQGDLQLSRLHNRAVAEQHFDLKAVSKTWLQVLQYASTDVLLP